MFMRLVCSLAHCENDLVLEDEGLHSLEDPPENNQDSKVLNPSKFHQLPESRIIGAVGVKENMSQLE